MSQLPDVPLKFTDATFLKLAREIAMGIHSIETILVSNKIDLDTWQTIRTNERFQTYLVSENANWQSALNTHERVKLKSAAMLEEWLPELYQRMEDPKESLNAKIEAGKLVARLAGMGLTNANVGEVGEKISVTINLGSDNQLTFEKTLPSKVIDGEVTECP